MVKSRLKKSAPECPFECGGGGVNAIWAMPTWGWRQVERGFPKVWGDLIVFHNLLRTSFHPEHCGAKNPGLIMAYIAATLNPEILKKFPGPVRVGKKKSGSGRVAGTRQGLFIGGIV